MQPSQPDQPGHASQPNGAEGKKVDAKGDEISPEQAQYMEAWDDFAQADELISEAHDIGAMPPATTLMERDARSERINSLKAAAAALRLGNGGVLDRRLEKTSVQARDISDVPPATTAKEPDACGERVVPPEADAAASLQRTDGVRDQQEAEKPRQRADAQDMAILRAIRDLDHNPRALPRTLKGKGGVKAAVRKHLGNRDLWVGSTTFNKAWQRLRDRGEILEETD